MQPDKAATVFRAACELCGLVSLRARELASLLATRGTASTPPRHLVQACRAAVIALPLVTHPACLAPEPGSRMSCAASGSPILRGWRFRLAMGNSRAQGAVRGERAGGLRGEGAGTRLGEGKVDPLV